MKERSVYSINQRRRLEAETRHEREERLQQLSDNQQRKLDTETTALRAQCLTCAAGYQRAAVDAPLSHV